MTPKTEEVREDVTNANYVSGFKKGIEVEREKIMYAIWRLDWIKIMNTAIKVRPTSWNEDPIREWRNASDEVVGALMNEATKKDIFEDQWKKAKKELEREE